ncbi:ornithine decarboxylase [Rhodococcus sp. BP-241]|uniref:aminotransferase class I/II-fold pyridoxal phosphate-dependent enzyme n=1 Tax=Rhodococcus sp. BP-241 TaxID=2739441 RepID=UPI001C9B6C29|nr:ornithine decarboxylase [Rhodococcus sp. BP-241]MBY6707863.1 ornithine decarboxylase [Rhodococcus sp. BP-241]
MAPDHSRAPFLEVLDDYHRLDRYGFTPPGHRQGRGADDRVVRVLGEQPFRADVLASSGVDDRQSSAGFLSAAEDLMADAVGADSVFFSTCGSSLSVKAAMMAVAGSGGTDGGLLLSRDAHKSVVAGLIFGGIEPRWITPQWDAERHLSHPPSPEQVEQAWQRHPDAAGALVVSPSPYGTCADIRGIAEVCHRRGRPLIVDEAWGAHLPFHDDLPTWAMNVDADVCVTSVHKMGAGFEQGSILQTRGDRVDADHLSQCADLLMTTSPNVLVYAALDGWRRQMVERGADILGRTLHLAKDTRSAIADLSGFTVMENELLGHQASHDLDRLQILVDVSDTGTTGYRCADWLREHHRIDVGMSDHRRILATMSMADDETTATRLLDGLTELAGVAHTFGGQGSVHLPSPGEVQLETVTSPREAFFGATEMVPAEQAAGRIAAEQLTPYPPGIPAVVPGERLNDPVIEYLRTGLTAGMAVPDAADGSLDHLRVVAT